MIRIPMLHPGDDVSDPRELYRAELAKAKAKREAEYARANEAVKAKEARIEAALPKGSNRRFSWPEKPSAVKP